MSTQGTFTVINKTGASLTGSVSHNNRADESAHLVDLPNGESTGKTDWYSGAGTHDSWHWKLSFNGGAPVQGSHGCALYAKDEHKNTVITLTADKIEIAPPESGNCSSSLT